MPLTRAQNKNLSHQANSTSNVKPAAKEINAGVKRKADGRKILGEIDGKPNSKAALGGRKILSTRLNNKNVASGSESLRTRRAGLRDTTNLEKITNSLKKGLSSMSKSSKDKAVKQPEPAPQIFSGHDKFCTVPIEEWRSEMKDELKRMNKFYDYEESVRGNLNESPEYSLGIFEYMKWREQRFEMKPYLDPGNAAYQTTFKVDDRRQLIDWMVEFQEIQESTHETLYLAVRLCDYYFSHKRVERDELQLYAFIGFLLAAKFEERWPPQFDDMTQLSDGQYKREDFTSAEENMLKTLNFDINIPISYRYLRRYAKCISMDMRAMTVSRFYLELTLQEYEFVAEGQGNMAAACLWIAMSTLGYDSLKRGRADASAKARQTKKFWSDQLTYYTGLHEWEVVPLARRIANVVRETQKNLRNLPTDDSEDEMYLNNPDLQNENYCKVVYKKYASDIFFQVAQKPIITDASVEVHLRRVISEKIDYEATLEPENKRRSTGCTTKMSKMSLRSTTPNIPERPAQANNGKTEIFTDAESTQFYSADRGSSHPGDVERDDEDKEN